MEIEDELYEEAVKITQARETVSISYIQRRLRVGYNRAANMVESMERSGIVGPPEVDAGRKVLIQSS